MNNSIDQQFVEFVVKSLVSKPDAVQVERRIDEKGVLLELTVDPEDLGRVIGKRGATAQSLRTLLRALGTKNDARYNLKIIDNGEPGHGHGGDDHSADQPAPANDQSDDSAGATSSVDDKPVDDTSDDAAATDETPQEAPSIDDIVEDHEVDVRNYDETSDKEESDAADRLSQTRKELEEFDDLDV